jgi:hypothetical protein
MKRRAVSEELMKHLKTEIETLEFGEIIIKPLNGKVDIITNYRTRFEEEEDKKLKIKEKNVERTD